MSGRSEETMLRLWECVMYDVVPDWVKDLSPVYRRELLRCTHEIAYFQVTGAMSWPHSFGCEFRLHIGRDFS